MQGRLSQYQPKGRDHGGNRQMKDDTDQTTLAVVAKIQREIKNASANIEANEQRKDITTK